MDRLLLQICFLLSGFAALVYQTAWTRQFAFVFGTSELAVATVLAAYMAGLAAGAAVAARVASRVRRPVLWYGLLELGIALCALAVPAAVRGVQALYVVLFATEGATADPSGAASAFFFLACSFAILMVPTGLMGATLPLLARHAVRDESEIGSRIGGLYAINTAGAVAGTLLAAFWLLPALGLRGTVFVAAGLNGLVFAVAALLSRIAPAPPAPRADASPAAAPQAGRFILPLILASGAASFTYEVLWTRLLSHAVGGSVYAFATMLASFLVGITVGSAFASRRATTRERAVRGFARAQLGTACLSFASYALLDRLPDLARGLEAAGGQPLTTDVALALLTLLPSALCIGATFPYAVRIAARDEADAGPASARVYSWNTVGAIVGAIGAGFFLLPWLGFEGTLLAAVATNLALAAACALRAPARGVVWAAAAAALALFFLRPGPPWNLIRTEALSRQAGTGRVSFYAVGRGATVVVEDEYGQHRVRTNGLPEATIASHGGRAARAGVAHWLGFLPVLARPELESMLVVGLGGGVALEAIPASVRRIDVVEIEPEVIAANREIAALRRVDPLADPRVVVHANDARNTLLLAEPGRLGAVVAQASHPWTAAASHLYTREFFELVGERLDGDGVFVQWIGLGFVDPSLLRTLVATLLDVFPHVEVYQPGGAMGVLFLASHRPLDVLAESSRALARSPDLFEPLGLATVEDVAAARVLDEAAAKRFAAGAPVGYDDRNLLQMRSPELRGRGLDVAGAARVFAKAREAAGSAAVPPGVDAFRLLRAIVDVHDAERALGVLDALPTPAARHAARGYVDLEAGQTARAGRELEAALRLDPASPEARAAFLRLRRPVRGAAAAADLPPADVRPVERAVVAGFGAEERGDWAALRASEEALAEASAGDPLHREALLLRASWRLAAGGPELAREARDLLDRVLARRTSPPELVLRARASLAAGETAAAIESLSEVGDLLAAAARASAQDRANLGFMPLDVADEALAVLATMPADVGAPADVDLVRARLEALRRRKG
jgi:spermidine synthase